MSRSDPESVDQSFPAQEEAAPLSWIALHIGPEEDPETLSLVLSAVGIDHRPDWRGRQLLVAPADLHQAREQLAHYRLENRNWPPPAAEPQPPAPPQPTLPILAALVLFFLTTGPWEDGNPWFARGAIDSQAILDQGQWWRLVTALTLHADLVHLLGNCLLGGLLIDFLSKTAGYGAAWWLVLVNGALGNLLNIAFRGQAHASVGLSTAVFAAVGLLSGLQLARSRGRSLKGLVLPLGAGVGLLAFLGTEGTRTDVGAHFFGFLCGLASGSGLGLAGLFAGQRSPSAQAAWLAAALLLVLTCWHRAMAG